MNPAARTVKCPQCGAAVEWSPASRWRPFCSQRCKTVDLGAWASETYRIPAAETPESEVEPAPEAARDTKPPDGR